MSDDTPTPPETPNEPVPPTEPIPVTEPVDPAVAAGAGAAAAGVPPTTPPPAGAAAAGGAKPPWYSNRGAVAAIIAVGLILIFLLIGWLTWWSDDDDDVDETLGTALVVDASTIPEASTIPDASIVDGSTVPTIEVTLPPETTAPPTTAPPTTVPPTTAPATTAPATTAPGTTTPPDGSVPDVTVPVGGGSLVDILSGNPDLSIVWGLVQDAGLDAVLAASPGPYTIFAPTNSAFDGVTPPTGIDLTNLISLHVVVDSLDSNAVLAETSLPSLAGQPLAVDAAAGTVGGAKILVTDLEGTTAPVGYIHVVDALLTAG